MDDASVQLLDELIKSKLGDLERTPLSASVSRGYTLFPLIDELRSSVDEQRAKAVAAIGNTTGVARAAHGRQLKRCLQRVDRIEWLTAYTAHIGRTDLPVGLWTLVDVLAEDLLGPDADTLITFDPSRMYSTISLGRTRTMSATPGVSQNAPDPNPIVFNLPDADPANILFSPILAHEVGHEVVQGKGLLQEVWNSADRAAVQAVLQRHSTLTQNEQNEWVQALVGWANELICDVIAVRLTGPSFLYALATFLPAPIAGDSVGTHPFGHDRTALALSQLDKLGWSHRVDAVNPELGVWMRQMAAQTVPAGPPIQQFLTESISIMIPAIESVVAAQVAAVMDAAGYDSVCDEILEAINAGIPPCQLSFGPPSPWQLVLAGWEAAVTNHGGDPSALAKSTADREFNQFLVKSLELIRVTELWSEL